MNSVKKIILITGGTGYIWSHATVAFEEAWYKTVILDNFINSSKDSLKGIVKILGYCPDFYECNICDELWLEAVFQKYEFDWVIHFAGLKAVGESCSNISTYHKNNIWGSMILFDLMSKYHVHKIVFSSSATVYAPENISPLSEEMPLSTINPYGTTKLVIEKLLEDYARNMGWSVMSLRYFNPIGAHISGYIWEIPKGVPNNLLPYLLDVACGRREKINILWSDYPTPDGTGVRDYIDINDLIEAHICAYAKLTQGFFPFNIWTGKWVSVLELVATLESVIGKDIKKEVISRRAWDLATVYAMCDKATEQLWWRATCSLRESIQNSWNFTCKL